MKALTELVRHKKTTQHVRMFLDKSLRINIIQTGRHAVLRHFTGEAPQWKSLCDGGKLLMSYSLRLVARIFFLSLCLSLCEDIDSRELTSIHFLFVCTA